MFVGVGGWVVRRLRRYLRWQGGGSGCAGCVERVWLRVHLRPSAWDGGGRKYLRSAVVGGRWWVLWVEGWRRVCRGDGEHAYQC